MADFPRLLFMFSLITLFSFLVIGFGLSVADIYGKNTTDFEDALNAEGYRNELDSMNSSAEGWKESWYGQEASIFSTLWGLSVTGIFKIALNMGDYILAPFRLLTGILVNVIGIPIQIAIFLNIVLILTIIFGLWRLIKTGQ